MALSGKTIGRVAALSDRLGVGVSARRLHRSFSPLARRNHRDDVNLQLLLAHVLARDSNCIDVGAHSGDVLADIVRLAPDGHHIAFEPLPLQAGALRARFPQVDVRNAAVGACAGNADFTVVTSNPQLSGLRDRHAAGESTEAITVAVECIDDVVDPARRVALLKIDVEGAEFGVLEGARELLARDGPTVVFEHGIGGSDHFGVSSADIHDLLAGDVGMRIFDIDGGGPYSRAEFAALFDKPIWFFVAHR